MAFSVDGYRLHTQCCDSALHTNRHLPTIRGQNPRQFDKIIAVFLGAVMF